MTIKDSPTITNKNSIAKLIDGNIFYLKYLENTYSEIEDFQEGCDAFEKLTQGNPVKVLVEMCAYATMSTKAREFAQENKKPAIAEALVLNSLAQRIIFTFYSRFRFQKHPLKVFKNVESALAWLKTI